MLAVELGDRVADPRARPTSRRPPRPRGAVRRRGRGRELAGDPRQPGAERERLAALARLHAGVGVGEQHPRVRLHRAGDVADQYQRAAGAGTGSRQRRSSGSPAWRSAARRVARWSRCDPRRATGPGAAPEPGRPAARDPGEDRPRERALGVGVLGEVLLAQQLDLARGRRPQLAGSARSSEPGAGSGTATRGRTAVATGSIGGSLRRLVAEAGSERGREPGQVLVLRAERGPQRQVRLARVGGVDRRERPMRVEQLADPDARPPGPHLAPSSRRPATDADDGRLRHPRAPPAPAPARCPRAPSAPRRASGRDRRRRRARPAPAPRRSSRRRRAACRAPRRAAVRPPRRRARRSRPGRPGSRVRTISASRARSG